MLDLDVTAIDEPLLGLRCDRHRHRRRRRRRGGSRSAFGGIDVVVANAGIGAQGTVADNDDEEWRCALDVNVLGVSRTVRAALPFLRRSAAAVVVDGVDRAVGGTPSGRSTGRRRGRWRR